MDLIFNGLISEVRIHREHTLGGSKQNLLCVLHVYVDAVYTCMYICICVYIKFNVHEKTLHRGARQASDSWIAVGIVYNN